ncbi:MAG: DegV family protein [Christensenellales bacterium]
MIKILVDSASDIDQQEANRKGISMIPIELQFGEEQYLDGVNLSHKEFFEKLIENAQLPKTSQINEYRWSEEFEKLTKNGDQVIAIVLSSKLSGTYNSAKAAAKKFDGKVFVVDSLSATIGERILCDYALHLIETGISAKEIVNKLEENKNRVQIIAVVNTLKYLRKGGRISSVTALAGEMLSIKPVISVINGEVKLVGKAIGSKKSNNLLMQLIEKCGGIDFNMPYSLGYSGLSDEYLQKYLKDSEAIWKEHVKDIKDIPSYMIGSTIGTHVGPNAIGVAFYALDKEKTNDKK